MSTHRNSNKISNLTLACLLCLPSIGVANSVSGNFEASLSNGVLVQLTVAAPASDLSRPFSGRIISDGVFQPIKGTLSFDSTNSDPAASLGSLVATISNLKEIAPIKLTYTPSNSEAAISEGLSVELTDPTNEAGSLTFSAHPAFQAALGQTNIPGVHVTAYRLDPSAVSTETVQMTLSEVASAITEILDETNKANPAGSLVDIKATIKTSTDTLALAKKTKEAKVKALKSAKTPFASYFTAYDAASTASTAATLAFAKAQAVAVKAIADKLIKETALAVESSTATSTAQGLVDVFASSIASLPLVPDPSMDITSAIVSSSKTSFKTAITNPNSKSITPDADGISAWDTAFSETSQTIGLDLLSSLFGNPDYTTASKKAFYSTIAPILSTYFDAAYAQSLGDAKLQLLSPANYTATHPTADFSNIDIAQQEVDSADQDVTTEQTTYNEALLKKTGLENALAALKTKKAQQEANLKLLGFKGYGNASILITSNATDKKAATTPTTAIFAGVAPDGQKWSYSTSLRVRSEDGTGAIYVNALAGKSTVLANFALSIPETPDPANPTTPAEKLTFVTSAPETGISWSHLTSTTSGPVAVTSRKTTANLFASEPLGETPTADVNVLVSFGESTPETTIGFGAVIQNTPDKTQNLVKRLLAAKTGSALTLTAATSPTEKALPSFSGKFTYAGTTPTAFTGILMESGTAALSGYGTLIVDATHTVPVTIAQAITSETATPPTAPSLADSIAWKAMKGSTLEFRLDDTPTELNITTATLLDAKGKSIATTTANSLGFYSFNTSAVGSGTYSVKIDREYVSGLFSATSTPFQVTQKTAPAGTFQMLLSYNQFTDTTSDARWSNLAALSSATGSNLKAEGSPLTWTYADHNFDALTDGNPYRARLTITTTSSGAFSGKLEFVDLKATTDEAGVAAPTNASNPELFPVTAEYAPKTPVLSSFTLKGDLISHAFSNPDYPEALFASIQIPSSTAVGAGAYPLSFAIIDGTLESPLDSTISPGSKTPTLFSCFRPSTAPAAEATPVFLIGSSVQAVTAGPKTAKGKYTGAGSGLAADRLGSTFSWDYSAGGATITYAVNGITGSANVGMDGSIAAMGIPQKFTTSKIDKTTGGSSQLLLNVYGFMEATLGSTEQGPFSVKASSLLFLTGSELESDPKKAGTFRYNTGWDAAAFKTRNNGRGLGSIALAEGMTDAFVPTALALVDSHVASDTEYTLTLLSNDASVTSPYTVKFTTKTTGAEVALTALSADAKAVIKSLTITNATALLSAKVQLAGTTAPVTISGVYLKDDSDATLLARGASADGEVILKINKVAP